MRDRRFGVEIECGYDGRGIDERECTCECWCEDERRYMRSQNEYRGGTYSQEQIDDFECDVCRGGCEGCYENSSYYEGCEIACNLLYDNGFSHWTDDIHEDGSGVEIPSPILQGREGLRELQRVMELLSSNGFNCSTADGMHVHHDAPEWVEDESLVAHTIELWEENLPLIRRFVDPYRTTSSMCASYTGEDPRYGPDSYQQRMWEEFKQTKDVSKMRDKFRALNIGHLSHTGSLEIRLHEGTLDFQKAAAWIRFGQGFLNFALKTYKRGQVITCESRTELLRSARVSSTTRRRLMAAGRSA